MPLQPNDGRMPRYNSGPTAPSRPTPPAQINYNYSRTPGPMSADQMIAQQQAKMSMQNMQKTARDHMKYNQMSGFNAESMARSGMAMQLPDFDQIQRNRHEMHMAGPEPSAFGIMPQMPFRQYPKFFDAPTEPMPARRPHPFMDGITAPGGQPDPRVKKMPYYPPDGEMTDGDWGNMYQLLSQQGAFSPDALQGY